MAVWRHARITHRKETMIALRARKQAVRIASEVANPHQPMPRTWTMPPRLPPWLWPVPTILRFFEPVELAPSWMKWFAAACVAAIAGAAWFILKTVHS